MKSSQVFVNRVPMQEREILMNLQNVQPLEFNLQLDMPKVDRCTLPGVINSAVINREVLLQIRGNLQRVDRSQLVHVQG
jgi:hypothetical protein